MKEITKKEFSKFEELSVYQEEFEKFPQTEKVTFDEFLSRVRKDGMLRTLVGYGLTRLAMCKEYIPIFLSFWSLYDRQSLLKPLEVLEMMDRSDKINVRRDNSGDLNIIHLLDKYVELEYGMKPKDISEKAARKILNELWESSRVFLIKDTLYIV